MTVVFCNLEGSIVLLVPAGNSSSVAMQVNIDNLFAA